MANLTESSSYDSGVRRLDATEKITGYNGSVSGLINAPIQNLTNRTKYLKDAVDILQRAQFETVETILGDWDNLTKPGLYKKTGIEENAPQNNTDSNFLVLVIASGNEMFQLANLSNTHDTLFWRRSDSGSWGEWHTIASKSYVDSQLGNVSDTLLTSTTPTAETIGITGSAGVATNVARADHVHGMPGLASTTSNGFLSSSDKNTLTKITVDNSNTIHIVPTPITPTRSIELGLRYIVNSLGNITYAEWALMFWSSTGNYLVSSPSVGQELIARDTRAMYGTTGDVVLKSLSESIINIDSSAKVGIGGSPISKLSITYDNPNSTTYANSPSIVLKNRHNSSSYDVLAGGVFVDTYHPTLATSVSGGAWFTRSPDSNYGSTTEFIVGLNNQSTLMPRQVLKLTYTGNLVLGNQTGVYTQIPSFQSRYGIIHGDESASLISSSVPFSSNFFINTHASKIPTLFTLENGSFAWKVGTAGLPSPGNPSQESEFSNVMTLSAAGELLVSKITATTTTQDSSDNSTNIASTAFVKNVIGSLPSGPDLSGYAPKASPTLTGTTTVDQLTGTKVTAVEIVATATTASGKIGLTVNGKTQLSGPVTASSSVSISGAVTTGSITNSGKITTNTLEVQTSGTAPTPAASSNSTDIATTAFVKTAINASSVPIGTIMYFAASTAPNGFLVCDGTSIGRSDYSTLFGIVGTLYGAGNGTDTFNLPDLRGEFIRGYDNGRGVDTSRTFGSAQTQQLQYHKHVASNNDGRNYSTVNGIGTGRYNVWNDSEQVRTDSNAALTGDGSHPEQTADMGSETRPRNIALLPCIKAYDAYNAPGLAEINVGDLATKSWANDTFATKGIFADSWSSGYQQLSSGLIIQWGYLDTVNTTNYSLPIAFPTKGVYISASAVGNASQDNVAAVFTTSPPSTFTVRQVNSNYGCYWVALGY